MLLGVVSLKVFLLKVFLIIVVVVEVIIVVEVVVEVLFKIIVEVVVEVVVIEIVLVFLGGESNTSAAPRRTIADWGELGVGQWPPQGFCFPQHGLVLGH
jgi:hypothetical protein